MMKDSRLRDEVPIYKSLGIVHRSDADSIVDVGYDTFKEKIYILAIFSNAC